VIILDTNVWSALNRPAQHPQVVDWVAAHTDEIWLSTIVIAEIRLGIENPKAIAKRSDLSQWLSDIELAFVERTIPFDSASAHQFGVLVARRKMEKQEAKLLDIQLASQSIAHDCALATRNVRDFSWTGVKLINPWEN
jgi:toxin FitB